MTRTSRAGANAPRTVATSAVANAAVALPSRTDMRTSPAAAAGSRTSATAAPSRPWATDAVAAPVVAQASAPTPRNQG